MSDAISALKNATFDGYAKIEELGPVGMIMLRCKPSAAVTATLAGAGITVPDPRRIAREGDLATGWMSPDELLLILPYAQVAQKIEALQQALGVEHFLAVDVSDARALFHIGGDRAASVLAKLMPVDFAAMEADELRRSRAGQVAAAVWRQEGGYRLVCFRSVAGYVMGLLSHSARTGSDH